MGVAARLAGETRSHRTPRRAGPRAIRVGEERLTAERIFINVGGRAVVPEMPGIEEIPYFTNSSIMDVDFVPPGICANVPQVRQ
jgi:pyruvate/2-oxoglutarate dehydrogenase complex dihydrolipoamide dehydrogenase (E3) component